LIVSELALKMSSQVKDVKSKISSVFVLHAKRHELYKSENNEPVILDESLFIRDKISK